jgi:hypothetical protein
MRFTMARPLLYSLPLTTNNTPTKAAKQLTTKELVMKRFYFLSVFALIAALLAIISDVDAGPKGPKKIINSGNATAKGGNGGSAVGKGAQGGAGGGAVAVSGGVSTTKGTGTASSGNATATGGNGGNATGPGAKGGNGGGAVAVSGNGNTVINGNGNTINNITKVTNNNISFSPGGIFGGFGGGGGGFVTGGGVVAAGGFGGDGVIVGDPGVAIAQSPGTTVITTDGSPAVAKGQDGADSNADQAEKESVFTRRFVKVKNDTDATVKVHLQYRGMDDKKWVWAPADPSDSQDSVVYNLKPGQEMFLEHNGSKVSASRIRLWGASESQTWNDYKDMDLWVVPEMDQRGEHRYQATEMKTFTFVFPKQAK